MREHRTSSRLPTRTNPPATPMTPESMRPITSPPTVGRGRISASEPSTRTGAELPESQDHEDRARRTRRSRRAGSRWRRSLRAGRAVPERNGNGIGSTSPRHGSIGPEWNRCPRGRRAAGRRGLGELHPATIQGRRAARASARPARPRRRTSAATAKIRVEPRRSVASPPRRPSGSDRLRGCVSRTTSRGDSVSLARTRASVRAGFGDRSLASRSWPRASADRPDGSTGSPSLAGRREPDGELAAPGLAGQGHRGAGEDQPDVPPGAHALVQQQHELLDDGPAGPLAVEIEQLALGEPAEELLVVEGELDRQDLLGRPAGREVPVAVGLRPVALEPAGRQAQGPLEPADQPRQAREPRPLLEPGQRIEQARRAGAAAPIVVATARAARGRTSASAGSPGRTARSSPASIALGRTPTGSSGGLLGIVHRPEHRVAQDHLGDPAPAVEQFDEVGQLGRVGDARQVAAEPGAQRPGVAERVLQLPRTAWPAARCCGRCAGRPAAAPIAKAEQHEQVQHRPERRAGSPPAITPRGTGRSRRRTRRSGRRRGRRGIRRPRRTGPTAGRRTPGNTRPGSGGTGAARRWLMAGRLQARRRAARPSPAGCSPGCSGRNARAGSTRGRRRRGRPDLRRRPPTASRKARSPEVRLGAG